MKFKTSVREKNKQQQQKHGKQEREDSTKSIRNAKYLTYKSDALTE